MLPSTSDGVGQVRIQAGPIINSHHSIYSSTQLLIHSYRRNYLLTGKTEHLLLHQPDNTIHKMQAELDSGHWVLDYTYFMYYL